MFFNQKFFGIRNFFVPKKLAGPRFFFYHNLTSPRSDPFLSKPQLNLNSYLTDFDKILNGGSWDRVEQIPSVKETFVQATFVHATFVYITNVSAVTDQILTKLGNLNFWNHNFFGTDFCQNPNPTSTQPNLTEVWVLHENDFTPPTTTTTHNTKLNVTNISAVIQPIFTK